MKSTKEKIRGKLFKIIELINEIEDKDLLDLAGQESDYRWDIGIDLDDAKDKIKTLIIDKVNKLED